MKRIALVHPRYGLEISGGSETYARKIAEHLANRYEVEVLTTKAVDSATWKDWYVRDVEMIRGVTVRRFSVQQMRARDFQAFDEAYLAELAQGRSNLVTEKEWFEKHGPYAPALIRYLQRYRETYGAILFLSDANYLTYAGLPLAGNRAIFIPMAQDTPFLRFSTLESLYQKPRAFVFLSEEERLLVRRQFPLSEPIPCAVMGLGMDVPRQVDTGTFRRQYGLDGEYLLYVGQVDEKKECPMLMRYFMEFQKRTGSKLKLVLAGKEDLPDSGASGYSGTGLFAGERKVQCHCRSQGRGDSVPTDGRFHDAAGIYGNVCAGAGQRRKSGAAGTLQKEQRRFVLSELF